MTYKKISGIYKIVNKIDNTFYVGSSINIYKRWYDHKWLLNKSKHHCEYLQNAWNKYGSNNFVFIVEKELLDASLSILIAEEQEVLDYCVMNEIKIYNTNKKAVLTSEEARKKISLKLKNKTVSDVTKKKIRKTLTGRKINPESAKKSAISRLGRQCSEETKQKIREKLKKQVVSAEMRKKISNTLKGRKISDEQRKKHLESLKKFRGENNPSAKLSFKEVIQIKDIRKNTNYTIKEIASMYDVCSSTIKNIISGKTYLVENAE